MGGHHHHHTLPDQSDRRYADIRRVTLIGSAIDLILGVLKILFGFISQSQALIADGIHSLSDLATDVMVLVAAKHGSQEADEKHPYGHGRFETLATVVLGIALILVAGGIVWDALERMFHPEELLIPGIGALVVAAASILSKEWIYHYTMALARRLKSKMLKANAWHSRSDAISSVVVLAGLLGTMAGLDYFDAVAAVIVGLMVAKIGWDLAWESVHELVDTGLDPERVEAIRQEIIGVDGVRELHMLRTRMMGGEALVDVHILVDPKLSVSEGHYISESVRRQLVDTVEEVQDVLVHIDPEDDEKIAPSQGLPSRETLLKKLFPHWAENPMADAIERITMHYLNGRMVVELFIPLSVEEECSQYRRWAEQLSSAASHVDEVDKIEVYFYYAQ